MMLTLWRYSIAESSVYEAAPFSQPSYNSVHAIYLVFLPFPLRKRDQIGGLVYRPRSPGSCPHCLLFLSERMVNRQPGHNLPGCRNRRVYIYPGLYLLSKSICLLPQPICLSLYPCIPLVCIFIAPLAERGYLLNLKYLFFPANIPPFGQLLYLL